MSTFLNKKWVTVVRIPSFGSTGTLEYLKFLAFKAPVETTPKGKYLKGSKREFAFTFSEPGQAESFTATLVKTFNPNFIEFATDVKNEFATAWEHLEAIVKAHDFHHAMSDDHRVWSNGQWELAQIHDLADSLARVDKERVRSIVKGIFSLN